MKIFILILAIIAYSAAIPLPEDDEGDNGFDPAEHEKMLVDLEEMGLEFFPNGTVKLSSAEDQLRLYYLKQNADDFTGNWTKEHFEPDNEEEEEDEISNNGRAKRTIFHDDERLPIPNSNLNSGLPYCALAEVSNGCTAIFIGPRHALTAGRCVYDRTTSRFRTGLYLYRGRNCYQSGTFMASTNLFTVNGYALNGNQEYDYGMIITATNSTCWATFGYNDPWSNRGLELLGYPTDKRTSPCIYHPAYHSACATSSTSRQDLYLQHRCDAFGTTGGPLISEFVDQVGRVRGQKGVVGVNVYSGFLYNYGPRINRDRFYQFISWMNQTGYDPLVN